MKLIIIGSAPDAHIRMTSLYVSGYHAELLLLDNGDILLADKASKNGTYLNDIRLAPNKEVSVKRGDTIRFANVPLDWNVVPQLQGLHDVKEIRGIGTNFRNKYQLQGERVSRFHATLKLKNDKKWYIQDHSRNGSTVNGQPLIKNQDIQLKKGDKITCAGTDVPNPYGTSRSGGKTGNGGDGRRVPRWVFRFLSVTLIVGCLCALFVYFKGCNMISGGGKSKEMTDEQIYAQYKNSTVLMVGYYYYKVSAGNLSLEDFGFPTEVAVNAKGSLVIIDGNKENMMSYTGTGFFVSTDGKIVTNLHIARPWLFTDNVSKISDLYKMQIAEKAQQFPQLNAFTNQIKVEGVIAYLGFIPNGEYFSGENLISCRELVAGEDTNIDVALLQTVTKRLPHEEVTYVDLEQAVIDDVDIRVGAHILTMGFPLGLSAQDLKSSNGIQQLARGGNITQESTEYSFGFDAASYGGASGSPIFNNKGQLIGVLNAGFSNSQGFNYGIKAKYVVELSNQYKKKRSL